jgi:hypothetical protein
MRRDRQGEGTVREFEMVISALASLFWENMAVIVNESL